MSHKGKILTLEIEDLAFDGKSIAHFDGKVVFLNGGLPGETVEAEITMDKPRYDKGFVRRIVEKSPNRQREVCPHFEYCGGCTWQDLDYDKQLFYKEKQVCDCIERIGALKEVEVRPIIGAESQFYYRNKMEFSFHVDREGGFTLGQHRRGKFDEIFDLHDCRLQSETSNRLVAWMREYVAAHEIPVYDVFRHTGFLRFFMIRNTANTDQLMINIVTNYGDIPDAAVLVESMTAAFPEITTIVHNQNGQKSNIATGEIENTLYGPGYIEERLFDRRFRIRANSFFQTNSRQAETLYRVGFELLEPEAHDRVLDLYCGTGSIGILLSDRVESVAGVELVEDAIIAARENAEINGIGNIEFHQGNVKDVLKADPSHKDRFDVVIIDPPRAGLHPKALKEVLALEPRKLLYISCNPATFARDAATFTEKGYRLPAVQPVDMFPHTMHIELAARFYK